MATLATKLSSVGTKMQLGTAACAIAAAAALPAVVAQAEPLVHVPTAGIGSSILAECDQVGSTDCAVSSPFAASSSSVSASHGNIFQNNLWWFGPQNPNRPPVTTLFSFQPLALLPSFVQPLFGWFQNLNFEACIGGFGLHVGPYGTVSGGYSSHC
jgi:hypothetical protein